MKDEALKKFREEYTTYVNAFNSNFSEIKELEEELEKDPRVIQLKKLQEEIINDPRTKRLEKLKKIKEDIKHQKYDLGSLEHSAENYALFATTPDVAGDDTYGIFLRCGPIDISEYDSENCRGKEIKYTYVDIESFDCKDVMEEESKKFEKGHIIIPVPAGVDMIGISREFLLGCVTEEPKEVAKTLAKKYNTIMKNSRC